MYCIKLLVDSISKDQICGFLVLIPTAAVIYSPTHPLLDLHAWAVVGLLAVLVSTDVFILTT